MTISLGVKSSFQFSPALTAHIERRIYHALHAHGAHIASVALRLSDVNGPRHGANDKLTRIDIRLRPSGSVMASARSDDIYVSVTRAATRARAALSKRIRQLKERARDSDRFAGRPDWPATADAKVAIGRHLARPYTNRPRPDNRSP